MLSPCSKVGTQAAERGRIISLMQLSLIREEISFLNRLFLVFHWPELGYIVVLRGRDTELSGFSASVVGRRLGRGRLEIGLGN